MAASPTMSGSSSTGSMPRSSSRSDAVQHLEHVARHPGARRLRRARAEGKIRAVQLRPRAQGALFRHLLRHADGGDRGGAASGRHRRTPAPPSSGPDAEPVVGLMTEWVRGNALERRNAGDDLGGTMRLGAYDCRLIAGSRVARHLWRRDDQRAPPPPLRGEHQLRGQLEAAGLLFSGMSPDGALPEIVELPGPSVVRRRAVPPRAEVEAVRPASAVHRFHPRRHRAEPAGINPPVFPAAGLSGRSDL